MNILNKLTIKHLMMNKKRTIVTIIGILLSTALMVGIGTIASTFIGYMIENTKSNEGSHHVILEDIPSDKIKYIKNNSDIEEYSISYEIGYAILEDGINNYKPYLYIVGADKTYLENSKLSKGRIPADDSEIIISSHISSNGGVKYHIGDKITLQIGTRSIEGELLNQNNPYTEEETFTPKYEKEYTVVGIMERSNDEPYSAPGYTVLTFSDDLDNTLLDVKITYKSPKNTKEKTEKIANAIGLEKYTDEYSSYYPEVDYNDSLLSYYGEGSYSSINNMILSIVIIVLALVMVGCAIVVYNSFAISVMERKKQFGLFSSIGATKKQLRKTVFFEVLIVSCIGIPLGILSGIFGIWVVVQIINLLFPTLDPKVHLIIIPMYIILPIIYMVFTVLISAILPSRRASKISPVEAIRLNDDIKVSRKQVKTNNFVKKVFGIEGELALKNMKRNKKKYRITILSLIVSIVLFLSFSAFLEYGIKSSTSFYAPHEADIYVEFPYGVESLEEYKEVLSKLKEIDSISELSSSYYMNEVINTEIGYMEAKEILWDPPYSNDYRKYNSYYVDNSGLPSLGFDLLILPSDEYKEYMDDLGLEYSKNQLVMICNNNYRYIDYDNAKVYEYHWLDEKYSKINFTFRSYSKRTDKIEESEYLEKTFQIPIIYVDKSPKLMDARGKFIISEEMYNLLQELYPKVELEGTYHTNFFPTINITAKDSFKTEEEIKEALDISENKDNYSVFNVKAAEQQDRNYILFISILLYGFITLVTLIGVTSVFNTINTSIALRRKEFAVLRSIGLTPKGFNKMIRYESLLYGLKSLIIGIPISLVLILFIKRAFNNVVVFENFIPVKPLIICILGVFIITFITMMYSTSKIKKENILDAIREENI